MKLRERFARFFGKQTEAIQALFLSPGAASLTAYDYPKLAEEGYSKNVYVYSAIRLIANSFSSVKWTLVKKLPDGSTEEIYTHPLLDLLARPNPLTPREKFFEELISFLYIGGVSFAFKAKVQGKTKELWTVRPDLVKVVTGTIFQPIKEYEVTTGIGTVVKRSPEETLYLRFFHPLGQFSGLSPVRVAGMVIDQSNESTKWNVSLLQNKANPAGIMKVKGKLLDREFANLKEQVSDAYAGAKNAGRPLLLEGDMDYQATGLSPTDMDWLEGAKQSGREIATALGVPPELLGDSANKTYANYGEARKAFYEETVLPLLNWVTGEFTNFLCREYGPELSFVPDIDSIEALQEDRDKLYTRVEQATFLTLNEKRLATGYEDIRGGDKLLLPLSLLPYGGSTSTTPLPAPTEEPAAEEDEEPEAEPVEPEAEEAGKAVPEVKAFNVVGAEAKTAYWKAFDNRRLAWEKRIANLAEDILKKDFSAAADAYRAGFNAQDAADRASQAIKDRAGNWESFYRAVYSQVGEDFAAQTYGSLKSCKPAEVKANVRDLWQEFVSNYVRKVSSEKIVGIGKTTMNAVRGEIDLGIEKGEGINEIAKRIDGLKLDPIIPNRSEVIARTETISASNMGSLAAAQSTGLALQKEWLATRDDRVRDAHLSADGQTANLDDPFKVGGETLMFPGDSSLGASAENTIQCRCAQTYTPVGEG